MKSSDLVRLKVIFWPFYLCLHWIVKFQGDDLEFVKQAKKIKKEEKKKKKEMKKLKKKQKKLLKKAQNDPEGDWKDQAKMIDTILNVCISIF